MNENDESVALESVNSVPTEKQETNLKSNPVDDYKRDMFKFKQEAKELRDKLEAIELEKEQKKGNYQGVISDLKDKVKNLSKEKEELKLNFATNALDEAIKNEAILRGIKDENQLEAFMLLVDKNAKGSVEFNERFEVKKDDVKVIVSDHLKRYGSLFNKNVKIADASPNNRPMGMPEKKVDIDSMSAKEYKEYVIKNKEKFKL